jgi:hypothetical protein
MPARHRKRYSSSLRKLSTITKAPCPRSNEIRIHNALEFLSIITAGIISQVFALEDRCAHG